MAEARSRSHKYIQRMNAFRNISTTTETSSSLDDVAATSAKPNSRFEDRMSFGSSEDDGDIDSDDDDDIDKDDEDDDGIDVRDKLEDDGQRILASKSSYSTLKIYTSFAYCVLAQRSSKIEYSK